jgi:anti-sigma28 factor (negative regulator of flagellin synthesis)
VSEADPAFEERRDLRMEQLRAKIESGSYSIPARDVADAILRHFRSQAKVAPPDLHESPQDGLI